MFKNIEANALEVFKSGTGDGAEICIALKDRQIYIRYFTVKDKNEKNLAILERRQNIAKIKKIGGKNAV